MKKNICALLAIATLAAPLPALAGTKTIDFSRADLKPSSTAAIDTSDDSIRLEDGSGGAVRLSFVFPKDFKKNSTAVLSMYFVADETGCSYDIYTGQVYRDRPGRVELYSGVSSENGFTAPAGPTAAPSAARKSFIKNFQIKKPNSGTWTSQQAGDLISLSVIRDGPSDSCSSVLWVIGARLTYQTN